MFSSLLMRFVRSHHRADRPDRGEHHFQRSRSRSDTNSRPSARPSTIPKSATDRHTLPANPEYRASPPFERRRGGRRWEREIERSSTYHRLSHERHSKPSRYFHRFDRRAWFSMILWCKSFICASNRLRQSRIGPKELNETKIEARRGKTTTFAHQFTRSSCSVSSINCFNSFSPAVRSVSGRVKRQNCANFFSNCRRVCWWRWSSCSSRLRWSREN